MTTGSVTATGPPVSIRCARRRCGGLPVALSHPTWFLVADGDQAIPPDAERQFAKRMGATTVEIASNHVAMVSHPDDTAKPIEVAAKAVAAS